MLTDEQFQEKINFFVDHCNICKLQSSRKPNSSSIHIEEQVLIVFCKDGDLSIHLHPNNGCDFNLVLKITNVINFARAKWHFLGNEHVNPDIKPKVA